MSGNKLIHVTARSMWYQNVYQGRQLKALGHQIDLITNITSRQLKTQQASLTTAAESGRGWHILNVQGVHRPVELECLGLISL